MVGNKLILLSISMNRKQEIVTDVELNNEEGWQ
jgi:hypothetical protein